MVAEDAAVVLRIFQEGIETGHATCETMPPSWPDFDASHLAECRFVAEADGIVLGWVALSPTSSRCAYAGVAEVSVYVGRAARGRGVGIALMESVVGESERAGLWTLVAGVFPENVASLALHQKMGFKVLGIRDKVVRMDGVWRDVVLLERRSEVAGI